MPGGRRLGKKARRRGFRFGALERSRLGGMAGFRFTTRIKGSEGRSHPSLLATWSDTEKELSFFSSKFRYCCIFNSESRTKVWNFGRFEKEIHMPTGMLPVE